MARYLRKNGDLFQHIPRTGGTWIENALRLSGIGCSRWISSAQPLNYATKHCLLGLYYKEYYNVVNRVFSFVRHPIPYYASVWKWMTQHHGVNCMKERWTWHPHLTVAKLYQPNFNDWVFMMLKKEPLWYTRLLENYVGPKGGEFCNYIGRTETLTTDFCEVMEWLGYEKEIETNRETLCSSGKLNASVGSPVEWSAELKAEVVETERLVIERFYGDNEGKRYYAPLVEGKDAKLAPHGRRVRT